MTSRESDQQPHQVAEGWDWGGERKDVLEDSEDVETVLDGSLGELVDGVIGV